MSELQFCRICLDNNVRMHQIRGSEVQDVYEKLTNMKVQEDGRPYFACYICYCRLNNCQQLVIRSQKSEELLKQICGNSELNLGCISFLDGFPHDLQNSFIVTQTESIQIPECNNSIKTENQNESSTYEVTVKEEPDDENIQIYCGSTTFYRVSQDVIPNRKPKCKLDEKPMITKDIDNSIECSIKETISGPETNVATNENKSSQIAFDIKSNEALVNDTITYFICDDCGKTFDTKALLIKHISRHKPLNIKPHINIRNAINNEKFIENDDSNNYLDIHTCDNKPFKCRYCSYKCKKNSNIKEHVRTHTGDSPYKCQYCCYTCNHISNLKVHIRSHKGEKPFKCKYCSYTCSHSSNLKKHIIIHTGEKPFKCQYCSYTSNRNSNLKDHIKTHTGEKPFKCQYCNYTCVSSGVLKRHIRSHTGENPFKCQYCNYTCNQNSNLKAHIRIHTAEKPFKCHLCSYTCNSNSNLKVHIRSHTREKPYKCEHCNYTCYRSTTLTEHIRTHTGERPFKCLYCSYTCNRNSNLKVHIRCHTGEKQSVLQLFM